jgi:hypothetical protein
MQNSNLPKKKSAVESWTLHQLTMSFFVFTQKVNNQQDPDAKSTINPSPQSVVMWVSIVVFCNTTVDNDNQPPWWCCTDVSQNCWGHKCHCSSRRYDRLLPTVLVQYNLISQRLERREPMIITQAYLSVPQKAKNILLLLRKQTKERREVITMVSSPHRIAYCSPNMLDDGYFDDDDYFATENDDEAEWCDDGDVLPGVRSASQAS